MLRQTLQAIDYLATKNLVHRDVKHENILFNKLGSNGAEYTLQLADFSLSNFISSAVTRCGIKVYSAPEILFSFGQQTTKMDVWSLFVTAAWAANAAASGTNCNIRSSTLRSR